MVGGCGRIVGHADCSACKRPLTNENTRPLSNTCEIRFLFGFVRFRNELFEAAAAQRSLSRQLEAGVARLRNIVLNGYLAAQAATARTTQMERVETAECQALQEAKAAEMNEYQAAQAATARRATQMERVETAECQALQEAKAEAAQMEKEVRAEDHATRTEKATVAQMAGLVEEFKSEESRLKMCLGQEESAGLSVTSCMEGVLANAESKTSEAQMMAECFREELASADTMHRSRLEGLESESLSKCRAFEANNQNMEFEQLRRSLHLSEVLREKQKSDIELALIKKDLQDKHIPLRSMPSWKTLMSLHGHAPGSCSSSDSFILSYDRSRDDKVAKGMPCMTTESSAEGSAEGCAEEAYTIVGACPMVSESVMPRAGIPVPGLNSGADTLVGDDGASESMDGWKVEGGVPSYVMNFGKHNEHFDQTVVNSQLAMALRNHGVDITPSWANGAKVLVEGVTPEMMEQVGFPPNTLRPWHVVIPASEEAGLLDALRMMPYRARPRVRNRHAVTLANDPAQDMSREGNDGSGDGEPDTNLETGDADEDMSEGTPPVPVQVTFVHFPLPLAISERSRFTQSSTDRHRIQNPRHRIQNPRKFGHL